MDNNIKIYSVNKWDKTDIYTASKQLIKFNYYRKNSKEYLKIDKVGGQKQDITITMKKKIITTIFIAVI